MSLQKLENYNNKEVIKEEVTILTDLLEEVTKNMLSPETFEKIIALKELAAVGNYEGLNEIVQSLSNKEMSYISRYFSILPLLINISEDVDLALRLTIKIMWVKIILGNYPQRLIWLLKRKTLLKFWSI